MKEPHTHALHTTYKTCSNSNSICYGSHISHIIMMAVAIQQRETYLDHFEDIQKRVPLHQNDLTTHQCLESLQTCIQKSLPLPAIAVLLTSCTLTMLGSRATAPCTTIVVIQLYDVGTNTNIHVKAFAVTTLKWFQGRKSSSSGRWLGKQREAESSCPIATNAVHTCQALFDRHQRFCVIWCLVTWLCQCSCLALSYWRSPECLHQSIGWQILVLTCSAPVLLQRIQMNSRYKQFIHMKH